MKTHGPNQTLSASSISHIYTQGTQQTQVLTEVSLSADSGEFCLLMGESGSGKSTLLAILSGLLQPTAGRVHVLGTDLWSLTEREREEFRRLHFGFVFQGYHLFSALTAKEQLELVLRQGSQMSRAEAHRQSLKMLESLGLAEKTSERPKKLSGGEKQRVAIGRALVKRPRFCFADEPTSALDSQNAHAVMEMFRQTARGMGSTVLVITHDQRMTSYADRIFRLSDGCLVSEISPALNAANLKEVHP